MAPRLSASPSPSDPARGSFDYYEVVIRLSISTVALLVLGLGGCFGGGPAPEVPPEQEVEADVSVVTAPGVVVAWQAINLETTDSGLVTGEVELAGSPSQADVLATSREILTELRSTLGYVAADLKLVSEPNGVYLDNRGWLIGSIKDSPYGLEIDRVNEVEVDGYAENLVEVVAWELNWPNTPTGQDYTIWLAYNDASVETPIDLDASDVDGQIAQRESRALSLVSSRLGISQETVSEAYERFDSFQEDYETYEFALG
jgi:hypothetical protein